MALLWVVIAGAAISFILAWSLGANDVANAFGTSVGSKVLSLRQAVVIASIVEFLGAFLMGSHVVDTMRKGIIKPALYEDDPEELMLGMLAALIGGATWLVLATFLSLPVSTTHSMVGAIVGFTLVAKGSAGVDWNSIIRIAISWVTSPLLAGAAACGLFVAVRQFILRRPNSLELGFGFLPFFYGAVLSSLCFFVIYKGSPGLGLANIPLWAIVCSCVGVGVGSLALCWVVGVPLLRKHIARKFADDILLDMEPFSDSATESQTLADQGVKRYGATTSTTTAGGQEQQLRKSYDSDDEDLVEEVAEELEKNFSEFTAKEYSVWHCCSPQSTVLSHHERRNEEMYSNSETFDAKTEELFSFLQILTASVGGFAHGANDVSNAIAPLVVIVSIYLRGDVDQQDAVPWWILLAGGVGISLGLAMWGYRVMSTIGTNMTKLTPSRGFNIEFGASMTVLVASRLKIPASTTHCVVGSVFAVGLADGIKAVNWRLLLNVVLSWVVTLPATGLISAAAFAALSAVRAPS